MKAAFDLEASRTGQERLLLTAAVAAGKEQIDAGYEIDNICKFVSNVFKVLLKKSEKINCYLK